MFTRILAGLAILAAVTSGVTVAQGQREPIKIGVLNATTGPLAVNGSEINEGIRFYWEDEMQGQVAGRAVRLIVEDEEGKPDVALTKTRKLVESDKVHMVLGPVSSASAVAMRDYMHERKVPLIITQATANTLTNERASPILFRSAMSSYQQEAAGGWYVAAKLGHKKIAVVGLDYVDVLRWFQEDPETEAVALIGEIGGDAEERAARFIMDGGFTKPVAAYIAGRTAVPGKRMGHAGAIIQGSSGTAESKMSALREAGASVGEMPSQVAEALRRLL